MAKKRRPMQESHQADQSKLDLLADALVRSDEMEETKDYLARGRRFAWMTDSAVEEAWAVAFRRWVNNEDLTAQAEMDDLDAELRLRKISRPTGLVKPELAKLRAAVIAHADDTQTREAIERKVAEFLNDLQKPKN